MEEIGIKIPPIQVCGLGSCSCVCLCLIVLNKAHHIQEPVAHTRPVTSSGAHPTYHEPEGDFYVRYKRLQKQLEFLQVC